VESSTQHPHAATNQLATNPTNPVIYHLGWCTRDQSTVPNLMLIAAGAAAVAYQQNASVTVLASTPPRDVFTSL
jgi:hypothetical protein